MEPWIFGVGVHSEGDDYVVTVRDLPSVVTSGDSLESALAQAQDAIVCDLGFLADQGRTVPRPSPVLEGEHTVALPAQFAAKLSVYEAWRATGISESELARRMGRSEAEIKRILALGHGTKLSQLDEAARALGGRLSVGFEMPV